MVHNAEATARSAEHSTTNVPGHCLQWARDRADIAALFPDAATAWRNAFHRHHGDRDPPRGAMVFWLGGSGGYGHVAVALGGGRVRSSDAAGAGRVATVPVGWVETNWALPYVGWADNVNDVRIPGVGEEMTEDEWTRLTDLIRTEVRAEVAKVWDSPITVTRPNGDDTTKEARQVVGETWRRVAKL